MIKDLRKSLDEKKVFSKDLFNQSKEKIEKTNNDVNAFNLVMDDFEEKNTNNILCGIPYALKDNISTKGIRTTACSNSLKNYVPPFNATVYEKLQNAGAVLVGKTNMDELAMGGTGTTGNTGVVKNPFDLTRIAGGSSAGSAAAVALDIVPFALGSDTGDSIRKPAAFCGVVGYKPSYGLISRYGLFAFASSLDHVGVFARTVEDAAIVTDEIKGYDEKDLTSIKDMNDVKLVDSLNNSIKGKKLFYIKELINPDIYPEEIAKKVFKNFNEILENAKKMGFEIYEESVDIKLLNAIKPVYDCISCSEATSNDSNLTGINFGPKTEGENVFEIMKKHRTENFSSLIKRRFVIGSFILQKENQEKYFLNAKRVRRLLVDKFNELFTKYDALIMPCSLSIAPKNEECNNTIRKENVIMENYMAIANFGGYPSITIPSGVVDNMPIGVNITGAYKDDANILNIAHALEGADNK